MIRLSDKLSDPKGTIMIIYSPPSVLVIGIWLRNTSVTPQALTCATTATGDSTLPTKCDTTISTTCVASWQVLQNFDAPMRALTSLA